MRPLRQGSPRLLVLVVASIIATWTITVSTMGCWTGNRSKLVRFDSAWNASAHCCRLSNPRWTTTTAAAAVGACSCHGSRLHMHARRADATHDACLTSQAPPAANGTSCGIDIPLSRERFDREIKDVDDPNRELKYPGIANMDEVRAGAFLAFDSHVCTYMSVPCLSAPFVCATLTKLPGTSRLQGGRARTSRSGHSCLA